VEVVKDVGGWLLVIALIGAGVVAAVRDAAKSRAQRRSVVAGTAIRYGPAGSYRPRSALWTGLVAVWAGLTLATALPFAGLLPQRWRAAALIGMAAATVIVMLVAARLLLDFVRTEVVTGRVLERRIIRSGEDGLVKNYWIAVDDGREPIAGTPVSLADYTRVVAGTQVRLHLTPRGRQLKRLEIVALPRPAAAFPGEQAPLFRRGTADLVISPAQAARVLHAPVELRAVDPGLPNARSYSYVPLGTPAASSAAPALHVTEAFDPDAAGELAHRVTQGSGKTWRPGNRGVFRSGLTYLLTWGDGALLIRGQIVDQDQATDVGRLVHTLRPPKPRA
jgi:hypothetical protein